MTQTVDQNWSVEALNALQERLYVVGRNWQATGKAQKPVFILPTRNRQSREQFVNTLLQYLCAEYGCDKLQFHADVLSETDSCSLIHMPRFNVTLCLMDC